MNIEQEKMIIEALPSLYPLQDFEEKAIHKVIDALPLAQPEIIRCRNCKFASGDSRICMKFGHSPIGELDFCAWAERRTKDEDTL